MCCLSAASLRCIALHRFFRFDSSNSSPLHPPLPPSPAGAAITFRSAGTAIVFDGDVSANGHNIVNADRIECNSLAFDNLEVGNLVLSGHRVASTAADGLVAAAPNGTSATLVCGPQRACEEVDGGMGREPPTERVLMGYEGTWWWVPASDPKSIRRNG